MNVDAQVGERQLVKVLEEVISSSRKTCELSLVISVRTSKPAHNRAEREEAERVLANRRQQVLHALTRMNGARGPAKRDWRRSGCSSEACRHWQERSYGESSC